MPDEQTLARWRVPLDRGLDLLPRPVARGVKPPEQRLMPAEPVGVPSAPVAVGRGTKFVVHPRYRAWLARCGLTSAEAVMGLSGEVVCGHTDRHVVRVSLRSGSSNRTVYLKREHVRGWRWRCKNWIDGFGRVSRCEREAATLAALEAAGLPGPQWLAYGVDAAGRGFLLVDDLAGATDVPSLLRDRELTPTESRQLATGIGTALAELHVAGFATPDLAAKHLFVSASLSGVSVIDWQSAPRGGRVREVDVIRWFGTLHAGLTDALAGPRDRLRVLWAYRRACRRLGRPSSLRFGFQAKAVQAAAARRVNRSSVRAQRHQPSDTPLRLVWVAGEEVVAIPEVAADWPAPAVCEPFYPATPRPTPPHGHRERVTLASGRSAVLVRFHTFDPAGRLVAAVRERPWRSPGALAARLLFHLQRYGINAPRLLAFGQRPVSAMAAESFVCAEMPAGVVPVDAFLARADGTPVQRAAVLAECGRLLRQLHDAGLRPVPSPSANDPLFVVVDDDTLSLAVGSPFALRLARRITRRERAADLRRFVAPFDRTTGGWVAGGYRGAETVPVETGGE